MDLPLPSHACAMSIEMADVEVDTVWAEEASKIISGIYITF
jgi:hypothetical protein